ncbi:PaaI family thioesterase [Sphingomicrobium sp. XHP0235]|uniref:PaaI family thioesterase n=1 Tax=Sphingomicrobium aquimarinum TaxID=3133971 RepID=UPI0031FF1D3E
MSAPPPEGAPAGMAAHLRGLESLYAAAPIQGRYASRLTLPEEGVSRLEFEVERGFFHAAGAAHGSVYFKMLDDAAFFAANTLVSDRFLLTTAFNLHFTRPMKAGPALAEGRWISGRRRVLVADARILDSEGEEYARGTGTFMRSHIPLAGLDGYTA